MSEWDVEVLAELERLGGAIHQDDEPALDAAGEAREREQVERYLALLDAIGESPAARADEAVVRSVLRSLHPIDDYGIYESAYGVLAAIEPAVLVRALVAELPAWLAKHGVHDSIATALATVLRSEGGMDRLLAAASGWDEAQREQVRAAALAWVREDDAFEELVLALGGELAPSGTDPIPEGWPEDWRAAALAFRDSGRVDLAWRDERDLSSSFQRVLAIMELGHGKRWREVPDLLNPLLVRRRKEIPAFARALAELPAARRARVLGAVERARPSAAAVLREHLEAL